MYYIIPFKRIYPRVRMAICSTAVLSIVAVLKAVASRTLRAPVLAHASHSKPSYTTTTIEQLDTPKCISFCCAQHKKEGFSFQPQSNC